MTEGVDGGCVMESEEKKRRKKADGKSSGEGKVLIRAGRQKEGGKPGGGDKAGSTAANRKTRSSLSNRP